MTKFIEILAQQELIDKLRENGYADFIDCILLNENKVFTRRGKMNKSGTCRTLGWKVKQLEAALEKCREIILNKPTDQATDEDKII